jgi:hypothetical protein
VNANRRSDIGVEGFLNGGGKSVSYSGGGDANSKGENSARWTGPALVSLKRDIGILICPYPNVSSE